MLIQSSSYGIQAYQQLSNQEPTSHAIPGEQTSIINDSAQNNADQVNISDNARNPSQAPQEVNKNQEPENENNLPARNDSPPRNNSTSAEKQEFDNQELREMQQLKTRDNEVRAHEQAHLAAAGQYATGGASFTYQTGPDGRRYAVGGEVGIDLSKENNPEATLLKMQTIKRAALAPADPSAADKQIAARASMMITEANQEIRAQQTGDSTPQNANQPNSTSESSAAEQSRQPFIPEDNPAPSTDSQPPPANQIALMIDAYKSNSTLA